MSISQGRKHIFLGTIADIGSPGLDVGSEEGKACGSIGEKYFVWMQCESEFTEKCLNYWNKGGEEITIGMEENHIIHVSAIMFQMKGMFDEVIELMEVEIP